MRLLKSILLLGFCLSAVLSFSQSRWTDSLEHRLTSQYSRLYILAEKHEFYNPPNYASDMFSLSYTIGKKYNNIVLFSGLIATYKFSRDPYAVEDSPGLITITHQDVNLKLDEYMSNNMLIIEVPIGLEFNFDEEPIVFEIGAVFRRWPKNYRIGINSFQGRLEPLINGGIKYKINDKTVFSSHVKYALKGFEDSAGFTFLASELVVNRPKFVTYKTFNFEIGIEYKLFR